MQVTVTGLYGDGGPLDLEAAPLLTSYASASPCPAAIALPPGSEVTLKASMPSGGEACPQLNYTPESITAPHSSANGQSTYYVSYASGGCSGQVGNFDFVPVADGNVSFYSDPQQDGGASWVLAVDFFPDPDAGACGVNEHCTNLYVGTDQKL